MGTAKQSIDEHCKSFFEEKTIDLRSLALQKTSNAAKEKKKTNFEQMCLFVCFAHLDVLTISMVLHNQTRLEK